MDKDNKKPVFKKGRIIGGGGQPLTVSEEVVVDTPGPESEFGRAVAGFVRAYRDAAKALVAGKFSNVHERLPLQWKRACHIWIFVCTDGVLVRYDRVTSTEEPKIRLAMTDQRLRDAAPLFSENFIHFPDDVQSYVVPHPGPGIELQVRDATGNVTRRERFHPMLLGQQLPLDMAIPSPPAPPPRLVGISNDFRIQLHGEMTPTESPPGSVPPPPNHFVVEGPAPLQVGWDAIEIYPVLPVSNFDPAYAALWAEIDLQSAIAQTYVRDNELAKIDGRARERERWAQKLNEFEGLLSGPEEPVHQFLKSHPEILSPVHERVWSKLPFGDRVSDFVIREIFNDYLLVEIEAPIKKLFRKDGRPRSALQAPIDQIRDWLAYLADNRVMLEEKYGLTGISVTPRTLVVIGRGRDLSEKDRARLRMLEQTNQKLRIRTYDDILAEARVIVGRLLGPTLPVAGPEARIFWYP